MIDLIILGSGGHAKEVYTNIENINDLSRYKKYNVLGFFDDITEKTSIWNLKVFKKIEDIKDKKIKLVLGVGTPEAKSILINKFQQRGFSFETIIHRSTFISKYAKIGMGAVIQSHCLLQPDTKIGDFFPAMTMCR